MGMNPPNVSLIARAFPRVEKKIMYQWRMWTGADRIGERPASDYAGESGVELHNYF